MATTTRAAVLVEKNGQPLAVEEIILQDPKGPEVLVEYFATGICHSQLTQMNHPAIKPPFLLGHEATGVVLKAGSDVTHIREGDHCIVTWVPRDINVDSPTLPPTSYEFRGEKHWAGVNTWSEHALLNEQLVVPLSNQVETAATAIVGCATVTGIGAVLGSAKVQKGQSVAVIGVGGVGINVIVGAKIAGGMSVAALMTMTAATGLYHKAIVQSAPGALTFDRDQASALGTKLIEDLGVAATDSEALRTAGTDRILEAGLGVLDLSNPDPAQRRPFPRPVLDGEVLTRPVLDAVAAGSAAGVPLLAGTTRDEMSLPLPEGATMDDLPSFLEHRLPAGIDLVALVAAFEKARGARGASISPSDVAAALVTEFGLRVPTTRLLDAQRQHQSAVYHYVFSWCSPTGDGRVKARHHTDTGILFGTHDVDDQHAEMFGQGPAADALAAAMQDAWAAFARTGNPSSSTLGDWPVYGEDRSTMFIGERTHVVQAPYEAERQALAAVSNELICSVQ